MLVEERLQNLINQEVEERLQNLVLKEAEDLLKDERKEFEKKLKEKDFKIQEMEKQNSELLNRINDLKIQLKEEN